MAKVHKHKIFRNKIVIWAARNIVKKSVGLEFVLMN